MALPLPAALSDIGPTWLGRALSDHAGVGAVRVSALDLQRSETWNVAETAFASVAYADPANPLPNRLFLKLRLSADPLASLFPGECAFYQADHPSDLPVAPCLAALRESDSGATILILKDLSASHAPTPWPLPPTLDRCHMAVRALADVHAHWAQAPEPGLSARERQLHEHVERLLPAFFAAMGDRLPPERADLLSTVCHEIPGLKAARYRTGGPVTRIHGDAHVWNLLYPLPGTDGQAVLIDWEDWRIDIPALDLALMIALHWYPDRRSRHEAELLQSYLDAFNARSRTPMRWKDLLQDYRLAHLCNAVVPLFQHAGGSRHSGWWSHLERWFLAFDDLGCRDLLPT